MSRYSARPSFTTDADFTVIRPMTLNGHELSRGDAVPKDDVPERVLRNLYDQRRIDIAPKISKAKAAPQRAPKADAAPSAPIPQPKAEVAPSAAPAAPDATDETPAYRIKQAGLGGFKVIDAKGQPIGPGFKTKAEAEAEIARLTAA